MNSRGLIQMQIEFDWESLSSSLALIPPKSFSLFRWEIKDAEKEGKGKVTLIWKLPVFFLASILSLHHNSERTREETDVFFIRRKPRSPFGWKFLSFLWPTTAASSCVQGNGIKRVGKKRKAKTTSTTHSSYSGRQRQRQRQGMKMEKRILGWSLLEFFHPYSSVSHINSRVHVRRIDRLRIPSPCLLTREEENVLE